MLVLATSRSIGILLHRATAAGFVAAVIMAGSLLAAPPALAGSGAHHGHCSGAHLRPDRADLRAMTRATFCLLDNARKAYGLPNLRASAALGRVARAHSHEMVAGGFFSDRSRQGASLAARVLASGAVHARAARRHGGRISFAENIAYASGSYATPEEVVKSWLRSAAHRELIVDRAFTRAGVGIALGMPVPSGADPCPCVTDTLDLLRGSAPATRRHPWQPPGARVPMLQSPASRRPRSHCRSLALAPSSCPSAYAPRGAPASG